MCNELGARIFAEVIMTAASVCLGDAISISLPAKITARGVVMDISIRLNGKTFTSTFHFVVSSLQFSQTSQRYNGSDGWDGMIPKQG